VFVPEVSALSPDRYSPVPRRWFHVHEYAWSMTNDDDYRRGRTCVFLIHAHLVFVTKCRRGVLTGEHLDYLRSVCADVCQDFGATLAEMDGEDDHVHIFSPDLG
jgi:hypothetical protein